MKFSRETLKNTAAGKIIENQQLLRHEEVLQKKKKIAQGYGHGWIIIGEDRPIFVRSRWEANLVCYFQYLKDKGLIKKWEYESETFYFEGIKRGTNNYKPDFKITENDGSCYFLEVKGYFTRKDFVKLNRMKKYHPNVNVRLLMDDKGFTKLHKEYPNVWFDKYTSYDAIAASSGLIKGWNQPLKRREDVQHLIPLPMKKPSPKKAKQAKLFD